MLGVCNTKTLGYEGYTPFVPPPDNIGDSRWVWTVYYWNYDWRGVWE